MLGRDTVVGLLVRFNSFYYMTIVLMNGKLSSNWCQSVCLCLWNICVLKKKLHVPKHSFGACFFSSRFDILLITSTVFTTCGYWLSNLFCHCYGDSVFALCEKEPCELASVSTCRLHTCTWTETRVCSLHFAL